MTSLSLILLLLIPLVGAIVCAFLSDALARGWALFVSLATLAVAIVIGVQMAQGSAPVFQSPDARIASLGFSFTLGVTPISFWLVLLTAFLTPLAIAASYGGIKERQPEYYAWMLALLVPMLGVFVARDLLLFMSSLN